MKGRNPNGQWWQTLLTALLMIAQIGFAQTAIIPKAQLDAESEVIEGMKYFNGGQFDKSAESFKRVAEKNNDPAAYFMLAKSYAGLDDVPLSILYAEKAIERDDNKFYREFLAEQYFLQGNYKSAADIYRNLIKKYPEDIENYFALSEVYLRQEKYNDAIKVYEAIEDEMGISEDISRQKQMIYLQQNKVDEAIKEGNKLMSSEPLTSGYVVQQAQMLIANERYDQARELLQKSIKQTPDFADAHVLLAEVYRLEGNYTQSTDELTAAFANNDLSIDTKTKILGSYVLTIHKDGKTEDVDKVIGLAKNLIEQSPDNARAYLILGDMYKQKGDFTAARDTYLKVTEYDKSLYEVWQTIAELDGQLKDNAALRKHSAEALEYFPNQAALWYQNGFANYALKDYDEAEFALGEARNLAFSNKALLSSTEALLGDVYNEKRDYKRADAAYEAALKAKPENEHALNNYSYFLSLRKENLPRAKELSAQLVEKYPDNPTYLDTHAWVLYQLKDYPNAKKYLSQAAALPDASGTVLEHYGDVLFRLGDKAGALVQWEKAKAKGGAGKQIDEKIASGNLIE